MRDFPTPLGALITMLLKMHENQEIGEALVRLSPRCWERFLCVAFSHQTQWVHTKFRGDMNLDNVKKEATGS